MPTLFFRLLQRLVGLRGWATPALVIIFVFVTSWPLMALFESSDSDLTDPANYWWWFLVTTSTVGYGDFYPETTGGHIVGVYVIVGGIATLTTLFTHLATTLERARGKRMSGAADLGRTHDHIVVLGYTPGRSERIIDELLADGRHSIVLGAWEDLDRHPMPDRGIGFVRGDLSDEQVQRRAGLTRARSVLVDARDDNEALAVAVTVHHVNPRLAPVVALRDMTRAEHLRYVDDSIRCVQWHTPNMITEELLDPGITQVYQELVTHGGGNTYAAELPERLGTVSFGTCQAAFGKKHDATLLAAKSDSTLLISPGWTTPIEPGTTLYYIGRQRLTAEEITRAVRGEQGLG